jgi:hypothetical protein
LFLLPIVLVALRKAEQGSNRVRIDFERVGKVFDSSLWRFETLQELSQIETCLEVVCVLFQTLFVSYDRLTLVAKLFLAHSNTEQANLICFFRHPFLKIRNRHLELLLPLTYFAFEEVNIF